MTEVYSYNDLANKINDLEKAYLLLVKSGSDICQCAFYNVKSAAQNIEDLHFFKADVAHVKDIHGQFDISSVPALLVFEKGKFKNVIKGCNDTTFYKSLFEEAVYQMHNTNEKPVKSVTVYSTPTCTWCHTLKSYLKKNRVYFNDIDVSRDPAAAEEMVKRSGQQGVPQTVIDGEVIIGFDKTRINRLLEINNVN